MRITKKLLALGLAMISAILALIAPNRLSKFADLIGEGLVPDTKMMQTIGEEINAYNKQCVQQQRHRHVEAQHRGILLVRRVGLAY